MSKPTSSVKRRYNKNAYIRHEFSIGIGTLLSEKIIEYKQDNNLSELIRDLLAVHFGVDADELYVPYILKIVDGMTVKVPTTDERYRTLLEKENLLQQL